MSEKVRDESSHAVTSNKHMAQPPDGGVDEGLMGYKGGAAQGVTLPGAGRPDGPADDGGAGGPTVGGDWGGMQANGTSGTGTDEIAVVESIPPIRGNVIDTEGIAKTGQ